MNSCENAPTPLYIDDLPNSSTIIIDAVTCGDTHGLATASNGTDLYIFNILNVR